MAAPIDKSLPLMKKYPILYAKTHLNLEKQGMI